MSLTPDQEWWTAQELADAGLPDLPTTKRRVNALAKRQGWDGKAEQCRRRAGRGGGREYHWILLPSRARAALLARRTDTPKPDPIRAQRDDMWVAFEATSEHLKGKARERLVLLQEVEALEAGGMTRNAAVNSIARLRTVGARSLWNWFNAVKGVRADDRLAYLVPAYKARAASKAVEVDPEFGDLIRADYLRDAQPSLTSAYDRACSIAEHQGIDVAPLHTVRRWLKRTVSPQTITLARKGVEALKAMYPPQQRDKSALHAMEAVNADFHKFDVFVQFPDEDTPRRPQMVAFQDIFSGRLLSWRVDKTPNSQAVQLCIGDLIETWGIPDHVLLDNGREFAAKSLTGGSKTRYRFKVREDDVPGLLTSLDCKIHWATPYSGQSKPIERAFRDLCDYVAKDPRFEGAYTGNKPGAQPESWGSHAVPLDEFLAVLTEGIERHNLRADRRSEVAYGRSFAAVFDESYANAPVRKATEAQRRLWLMGAEGVRPHSNTGEVRFMGNRYHAEFLYAHRGQKMVARFDPADLFSGLHIYTLSDEYLGHAACLEAAGFFDVDAAKQQTSARKAWMKAEKEALKALQVQTAADLASQLRDARADVMPSEPPEGKVVRLDMTARSAPTKETPPDAEKAREIANLSDRRGAKAPLVEDPRALFLRARELERQEAQGTSLAPEQKRWLISFQSTADYKTYADMVSRHGDEVLGQ